MARFKGESSGRNVVQYAEAKIADACSQLCTHVNNEVSTLNTNKLSTSGSGANLSNVVHSITAGTGLSVNQSTGSVTIDASSSGAEGAPEILYSCKQCWNGVMCIPSDKRGAFTSYEIFGQTSYWHYYCSSASYCFEAQPGCSNNPYGGWCCNHCACGWMGDGKCNNGTYRYDCAGQIVWPFGCDSGCRTACSAVGFVFHNRIMPENPCNTGNRGWRYCFRTSNNGGSMCCQGNGNAGYAYNCCGMAPQCLKCLCWNTPSGSSGFQGYHTTVTVVGYGRLPV